MDLSQSATSSSETDSFPHRVSAVSIKGTNVAGPRHKNALVKIKESLMPFKQHYLTHTSPDSDQQRHFLSSNATTGPQAEGTQYLLASERALLYQKNYRNETDHQQQSTVRLVANQQQQQPQYGYGYVASCLNIGSASKPDTKITNGAAPADSKNWEMLKQLERIGFYRNDAIAALKATGYQGVDEAASYLNRCRSARHIPAENDSNSSRSSSPVLGNDSAYRLTTNVNRNDVLLNGGGGRATEVDSGSSSTPTAGNLQQQNRRPTMNPQQQSIQQQRMMQQTVVTTTMSSTPPHLQITTGGGRKQSITAVSIEPVSMDALSQHHQRIAAANGGSHQAPTKVLSAHIDPAMFSSVTLNVSPAHRPGSGFMPTSNQGVDGSGGADFKVGSSPRKISGTQFAREQEEAHKNDSQNRVLQYEMLANTPTGHTMSMHASGGPITSGAATLSTGIGENYGRVDHTGWVANDIGLERRSHQQYASDAYDSSPATPVASFSQLSMSGSATHDAVARALSSSVYGDPHIRGHPQAGPDNCIPITAGTPFGPVSSRGRETTFGGGGGVSGYDQKSLAEHEFFSGAIDPAANPNPDFMNNYGYQYVDNPRQKLGYQFERTKQNTRSTSGMMVPAVTPGNAEPSVKDLLEKADSLLGRSAGTDKNQHLQQQRQRAQFRQFVQHQDSYLQQQMMVYPSPTSTPPPQQQKHPFPGHFAGTPHSGVPGLHGNVYGSFHQPPETQRISTSSSEGGSQLAAYDRNKFVPATGSNQPHHPGLTHTGQDTAALAAKDNFIDAAENTDASNVSQYHTSSPDSTLQRYPAAYSQRQHLQQRPYQLERSSTPQERDDDDEVLSNISRTPSSTSSSSRIHQQQQTHKHSSHQQQYLSPGIHDYNNMSPANNPAGRNSPTSSLSTESSLENSALNPAFLRHTVAQNQQHVPHSGAMASNHHPQSVSALAARLGSSVAGGSGSGEVVRSASPLPDSIRRRIEADAYEPYVKQMTPKALKFFMEQHVENVIKQHKERERRMLQLNRELSHCQLPQQVQSGMRRLLMQKESQYLRLKRQRLDSSMFKKVCVIGQGAFGEVVLVRKHDTQMLYAMKVLNKRDVVRKNQTAHVKAERDILSEADNAWVVKLYYSFQDKDKLFFIMEYIPGGDLMALLIKKGIFEEKLAKFYIAELVCAIESVHKLKFIHRDIKPDNILIDKDGHIKLTDFGLCTGFRWTHESKYYRDHGAPNHESQDSFDALSTDGKLLHYRHAKQKTRQQAHSLVGTPNYIAPEVLERTGHTQLCDWWSVGVILYEMLVGCPPFHADNPAETQIKIIHWRRCLQIPPDRPMSENARLLIYQLCCDKKDRLGKNKGAPDIKGHPWFQGTSWKNLRQTVALYKPEILHDTDTSNFDPVPSNSEDRRNTANFDALPEHAFYEFTFRRFFEPDGRGCPTLRLPSTSGGGGVVAGGASSAGSDSNQSKPSSRHPSGSGKHKSPKSKDTTSSGAAGRHGGDSDTTTTSAIMTRSTLSGNTTATTTSDDPTSISSNTTTTTTTNSGSIHRPHKNHRSGNPKRVKEKNKSSPRHLNPDESSQKKSKSRRSASSSALKVSSRRSASKHETAAEEHTTTDVTGHFDQTTPTPGHQPNAAATRQSSAAASNKVSPALLAGFNNSNGEHIVSIDKSRRLNGAFLKAHELFSRNSSSKQQQQPQQNHSYLHQHFSRKVGNFPKSFSASSSAINVAANAVKDDDNNEDLPHSPPHTGKYMSQVVKSKLQHTTPTADVKTTNILRTDGNNNSTRIFSDEIEESKTVVAISNVRGSTGESQNSGLPKAIRSGSICSGAVNILKIGRGSDDD